MQTADDYGNLTATKAITIMFLVQQTLISPGNHHKPVALPPKLPGVCSAVVHWSPLRFEPVHRHACQLVILKCLLVWWKYLKKWRQGVGTGADLHASNTKRVRGTPGRTTIKLKQGAKNLITKTRLHYSNRRKWNQKLSKTKSHHKLCRWRIVPFCIW